MLSRLKNDLKEAMKVKDESKKDAIRLILGELPRLNKKPEDITDEDVVNVMRKLKKDAIEVCEAAGETTSDFIKILESYLPAQLSEEIIEQWIRDNIDFSKLPNPGKAIGMVIAHFGKLVDGKIVSKIINNMEK